MSRAHLILLSLLLSTPFSTRASANNLSEPGINARLVSYYSEARNYRRVRRDVLDWHKTTRNGCVAFASTALRHIGFDIPVRGKRDGWGVSRITFAFSDFLEEAGWTRIDNAADIAPGDLAFTTGYPDHVFVFHSWSNRRHRVARILDNKGYLARRAFTPAAGSSNSAFAYALRAPVGGQP